MGPERINDWQTVAELLTHKDPGTERVVDEDEGKGARKLTLPNRKPHPKCFIFGESSNSQHNPRI